jgi:arabinan endo-1,5-alpha-L-arabinosidase
MVRSGRVVRAGLAALVGALLIVFGGVTSVPAQGAPRTAEPAPPAVRPADPIAHDPTMVKEGRWYYLVITGDSGQPNTFLPVKRSKDLVHWTTLAPVFSTLPSWILPALGLSADEAPKDLWAPDLSYVNGEWRLYYAISQFGQNNSVIGLVTTKTLNPASKDFGWVDRGLVLQSKPATAPDPQEFNAIDPELTTDARGRQWLSFGSFWTGIKMRRINPATGHLSTTDTTLHDLATRPTPPDAIEGPAIIRHGGYYYLFVAFDYCCRSVESDYRVMVGRSRSITGPYRDRAGVPLLEGGGTEVLRGYNEFVGTGGADTFSHGGRDYLVNHYYDATDNGVPKLNVRPVRWRGGWPSVDDPHNPSRSVGHGDAYLKIIPRGGSTVVEDNGCGYEGANIGLWNDLGNPCQQWQVSDRGNGSRILNRYSNKVAEIAACNNVDGGNVAQWGWLGFLPNNDCQRWSFAPAGDGYSTIASILPGHRVWHVAGGQPTAGANIDVTTPAPASAAQKFRFQPVGRVLLASPRNTVKTLGVVRCRVDTGHGQRLRFQTGSSRGCQEWRIRSVDGDAARYTVTNVATGKQLATAKSGSTRDLAHVRLVRPGAHSLSHRSWTLTPTDGAWVLANHGTSVTIKLLIP